MRPIQPNITITRQIMPNDYRNTLQLSQVIIIILSSSPDVNKYVIFKLQQRAVQWLLVQYLVGHRQPNCH